MIAVIQRSKSGSVSVDETIISQIELGFVILLGVIDEDDETDADYLADKITHLRVFNDDNKKMNLSIQDVKGSALVISQFTYAAIYARDVALVLSMLHLQKKEISFMNTS